MHPGAPHLIQVAANIHGISPPPDSVSRFEEEHLEPGYTQVSTGCQACVTSAHYYHVERGLLIGDILRRCDNTSTFETTTENASVVLEIEAVLGCHVGIRIEWTLKNRKYNSYRLSGVGIYTIAVPRVTWLSYNIPLQV